MSELQVDWQLKAQAVVELCTTWVHMTS